MKYHWIVFDADDTLFDFGAAEHHAIGRLLTGIGLADTQEHRDLYTGINRHLWQEMERGAIRPEAIKLMRIRRLFDEVGIDEAAEPWAERFLDFLAEGSTLLPGTLTTLQRLAQRAQLAVLTNGLTRVQRPRLEHSGLAPLISALVVSEDVGVGKPDPRIFEAMNLAMGSPARDRVLMVGDRYETDIQGGRNFGWDTAWLTPSVPADVEPPTRHLHRIESLTDWLLDA
ncbi:YjjG family noncanonical pyrimidine nucleotidase [Saccharospirillum mangrovi]|uniref:YjjG family noncanonical pyrimidine nucleotidase n=1 Tax=Saccharospirillum mangrovi TaxID=2161747 RepID=UPI000D3B3E37|nr:YjjG family noncanonical pyrimidine nucleotidase [Saccharospirillum mangrovi]